MTKGTPITSPSSLEKVLHATPPPSVAALPSDAQDRLATQIRDARRLQMERTDVAVEKALKGVPLPLRGAVRKAVKG